MKRTAFFSPIIALTLMVAVPVQAKSLYALGTVHAGLLTDTSIEAQAVGVQAGTDVNARVEGNVRAEGESNTNGTTSTNEGSIEVETETEGEMDVNVGGWDSTEKKEIVVTRDTVDMTAQGYADAAVNVNEVKTSADLEAVAHAVVAEDENISEVTLKPGETHVSYEVPGKFLGLFPMTLTAQITLDQEGYVKVAYPWFAALVKKQVDFDEREIENEIKASLVVTAGGDTLAAQASGLQALGSVLKVTHDISFAASVAE